MALQALVYQDFEGGWSTDLKVGIKNSQAYTQAMDFRKQPSQMSVLPGLTREDNGVVKGLIGNEVMITDGTIYATDTSGFLYKRTTAGVWSAAGGIGTFTFGMDYRFDTDDIYICQNKHVSLFSQMSTNPILYMNYYGSSYSTFNNSANTAPLYVAAYQSGSSLTYTPSTAISEAQTNLRYFQSDIEPLNQISVFITSKGTGDWTLTLHDGLNHVLATSTVTNANLTNNTFNDFKFTSATNGQVRIYVTPNNRTYHIHLTSTVADGKLSTSLANDMSRCDLEVWADRLVMTRNRMHPMTRFQQWECFGNGNYVSIWEPISDPPTDAEWQRHKLWVPMQYECCGIDQTNEFLVAAFEQTTTDVTNNPHEGLIIFWDGLNPTYNYFVRIPEGSPYALHTYKNVVYYFAGGDWWTITSPTTDPVKIRQMPGSDTEFSGSNASTIIFPNAATVRRNIHLMSWPSYTTNSSINYGVYSWGSVDKNFPDSFGLNYILSTGRTNSQSQTLTNLITNPSMGASIAGWTVEQGPEVLAQTSSKAYYGTYSMSVQTNGTANSGAFYTTTSISSSHAYTFSVYVFMNNGVAGRIQMDEFNGASFLKNTSQAFTGTGTWQRLNMTITTLSTTNKINVSVITSATTTFYIDAVMLESGATAHAYFDGSFTSSIGNIYAWTGTTSLSTSTYTYSDLMIGMVKAFGDILHVSYRDDQNGGYGMDVITNASKPASTAIWQSMIFDDGRSGKQKTAKYIEAYFNLPAGATIQLGYSIDRGDWVNDDNIYSTDNLFQGITGYARFDVTENAGGRFFEFQQQIIVTCDDTVATPPEIFEAGFVFDNNKNEEW